MGVAVKAVPVRLCTPLNVNCGKRRVNYNEKPTYITNVYWSCIIYVRSYGVALNRIFYIVTLLLGQFLQIIHLSTT